MKTLHIPMTMIRIIPWVLLAATTACSNPMACPGEVGAPIDEYGNEVDPGHNPNTKPRLNTDCYYGRSSNGRIVLLTQKPQTGFWNSSVYRSDQQVPMNPALLPMSPQMLP